MNNRFGLYKFINDGVKVGAFTKMFVVTYSVGKEFVFAEFDTLSAAIKAKGRLSREGHKVAITIEVFPRWD